MVAPGETLSTIARTHDTDVATLLRLNELRDPNVVHAGQQLRLPAAAGSRARQDNTEVPSSCLHPPPWNPASPHASTSSAQATR